MTRGGRERLSVTFKNGEMASYKPPRVFSTVLPEIIAIKKTPYHVRTYDRLRAGDITLYQIRVYDQGIIHLIGDNVHFGLHL